MKIKCFIAFIATVLCVSCAKETSPLLGANENDSQAVESFLGKDLSSSIDAAVSLYSSALHQSINYYVASGRTDVTHEDVEDRLSEVLSQKVSRRSGSNDDYSSSESGVYITMNAEKLQRYMDALRFRLEAAENNSQNIESEEDLVKYFNKVASEYYQSILRDNTLTDLEKKDIITAAKISTGVLCVNVENMDAFVSNQPELRSLGGWLKKRWKAIRCGIGIVTTIGGGVLSAVAPVAGVPISVAGFGYARYNC